MLQPAGEHVEAVDAAPPTPRVDLHLASRRQRLGGAAIDLGLLLACAAVPIAWELRLGLSQWKDAYLEVRLLGYALLAQLPLRAVQALLVARTGRSLGKWIVKTRIVRSDGRTVGFVHGVLLRDWLPLVLTLGASCLALADWIFALRADHRCLHDHIADTVVVRTQT